MIYDLGDSYFVRPLRETDLDGPYPSWFEDQEVCRYNSHGKFARNEAWFRSYYDSLDREDRLVWAICHGEDGHIGNTSLSSMSFINRHAEFAIIVGNSAHWGRSVGFRAGSAILNHGFSKLNLERIYCGTAATNSGMQALAAKLGMVEEGRRRKHLFLDGEWVDVVEYGVLREEFTPMEAASR
jgi:[ribosomal protein S5]-alanine N-acetyltransferase